MEQLAKLVLMVLIWGKELLIRGGIDWIAYRRRSRGWCRNTNLCSKKRKLWSFLTFTRFFDYKEK